MSRSLVLAAVMAALTACASVPAAPVASPSPAEPSATSNGARGLPPGCETIDLRGPTGERVDLRGEWAGSGVLAYEGERAWLSQIGNCVYGSVLGGAFVREGEVEATLANLRGRVGSDFRIELEVVFVFQDVRFPFGEYSAMPMVIEWDADGRIRLREDRVPGDAAGRCIHVPQLPCVNPVIWYRVDDVPPS
ncbi:MAG: hypothetical protein ACRDGH_16390 [Candidatus Limnocylindria bacterium]